MAVPVHARAKQTTINSQKFTVIMWFILICKNNPKNGMHNIVVIPGYVSYVEKNCSLARETARRRNQLEPSPASTPQADQPARLPK